MTNLDYCFLVVAMFTPALIIRFSIDLQNIALFIDFVLFFDFVTFFSALCKSVFRSIYGFKNSSCLNSKILRFFFSIAALSLREF